MKIWVMLGEGFEEIEALAVVDVARRANLETIMVSASSDLQVTSARGIRVIADKLLTEVTVDKDDAIVIPGGKGIQVLNESNLIKELVVKHRGHKGLIAAICAGPMLPGNLGLLEGIKATCFPGYEQYLRGAIVVDEDVVTDQNCVTARGAGVSLAFAYAIVEVIKGREEADKLRSVMQYRKNN